MIAAPLPLKYFHTNIPPLPPPPQGDKIVPLVVVHIANGRTFEHADVVCRHPDLIVLSAIPVQHAYASHTRRNGGAYGERGGRTPCQISRGRCRHLRGRLEVTLW